MEETMGDRIKRRRKAVGYRSQEALADALKVSRSAVQNWEAGTNVPEGANLIRLADKLGVSVEWLLHGDRYVYRDAFRKIAAVVDETRRKVPTDRTGESGPRQRGEAAGEARNRQEGAGEEDAGTNDGGA